MDLKVLDLPLKVLKVSGFDLRGNSWIAKTKCLAALVTGMILLITCVMEMYLIKEWSIITIVPEVEAFMAALETLLRWFTLFIFERQISELIAESKTFWKIDDVDPNDESGAKAIMYLILKGTKIYATSVILSGATAMAVAVVFNWGKTLPFAAWFPENYSYGYEIFFVMQMVYVLTTLSVIVGADALFGAFCGQLIAQFKLLNRKLENTKHIETTKDFLLNLEESVRYHLKLIEFGEKLGYVYFILLLGQYVITVSASCVELFMVSEYMNDLSQISRFVTYMITLSTEMAIFCFLAEAVMDESANTSVAVYGSDWYSRDVKEVGGHVQMIMRRASKPITFSGGGLFLIGRVAWFNVFKMSFSIFTLLTSIK